MTLNVDEGKGYVPAVKHSNGEDAPLGTIFIDSFFHQLEKFLLKLKIQELGK